MRHIKFLFIGILFGIVLSKAEVISWYRIYEMFKFQSFHMYGIIGSAVVIGIIIFRFFNKGLYNNILTLFVSYKINFKSHGESN